MKKIRGIKLSTTVKQLLRSGLDDSRYCYPVEIFLVFKFCLEI